MLCGGTRGLLGSMLVMGLRRFVFSSGKVGLDVNCVTVPAH